MFIKPHFMELFMEFEIILWCKQLQDEMHDKKDEMIHAYIWFN